ncbi:MAG: ribonucleotide reductase subunit alpha [Glaciimonas sp.]|nr:ribonucleotide reductase subunit alpha [Glaciimonas sp.]
MSISNFEDLLQVAAQQPDPQRLLFVFAKKELPDEHVAAEAQSFQAGLGGALTPVVCVDKTLDALSNFSALVRESEQTGQHWDVVLVACLSGKNGIMPSASEADQGLKKMVGAVQTGAKLSQFIAFDRAGDPLQFA